MALLDPIVQALSSVLVFFHDALAPVTGLAAWGWAIVVLTLAVRVVLLPLAVKQTTSMRATQKLAPEIKKIQAKYKADRTMMRSDPERYRELRAKQQEATMALYKDHGVNPAASCLPLVAQMPVFFALYTVLNSSQYVPQLRDAPFYFIESLSLTVTDPGARGAIALIVLMGLSTFFSQKQTMAANPSAMEQPQQRMLLYIMPAVLTVFGFNLPVGVLLYWVTTNLWTMAQQYVIFRAARDDVAVGTIPATAALTGAVSIAPVDGADVDDDGNGKGAPTPKRGEARKARATARGTGTGVSGGDAGRSGNRGTAATGKQKRT